MIFKRKVYDELLQWKQEDDGTTAILIKKRVVSENLLSPRRSPAMRTKLIY